MPLAAVSPRFGGGSGLKPLRGLSMSAYVSISLVSPRFGGGRGLKHSGAVDIVVNC